MFKRGFDVVVGTLLGIVAAPVVVVCAIALAINDGWPLLVHDRIGADGRVFRFIKLRTLRRTPLSTPSSTPFRTFERHRWSVYSGGSASTSCPSSTSSL